jgi:alkylhydroperoxidase/carboxymuconolactone decarboxylase family protein YurZ
MAESSEQGTAAATPMQQVAPYLVELSGKVLFGDIWQRPGLAPRDRSLATITVLIGRFRTDELRWHHASRLLLRMAGRQQRVPDRRRGVRRT